MEGEQTGCVIQRNVRNEAVQVHVNEELEVRTCSRTNLGIFHVKFGRHVHVNEGLVNLVVWIDFVKGRPWHILSQIWYM